MRFSVMPVQVFRKPCLVELSSLAVLGLKIASCRYCASSGLFLWEIMLFITVSYCCVSRDISHISFCFFLVPFIIYFRLLWTEISCLYSGMVNPSSQKTHNDISGSVSIFGKIWIWLACLLSPISCILAIFDDSIVIPSGSIAVMLFGIITGAILWWLVWLGVYLNPNLRLLACFY